MSTQPKPGKRPVPLQPAESARPQGARPSRIRRQPPATAQNSLAKNAWWESREWEIRLAIGGIVFFALAISAVVIDLAHLLGV